MAGVVRGFGGPGTCEPDLLAGIDSPLGGQLPGLRHAFPREGQHLERVAVGSSGSGFLGEPFADPGVHRAPLRGDFDAIVTVDLAHDLCRPAVQAEGFQHSPLHLPAKKVQTRVRRDHSAPPCRQLSAFVLGAGALRYYASGFVSKRPNRRGSVACRACTSTSGCMCTKTPLPCARQRFRMSLAALR